MDPKTRSPSDAVAVVSRLLALAGGGGDPAAVRAAVVEEEAAAFFGVPHALLLALEDSDRRARVVAGTRAAGARLQDGVHEVRALPALQELVAGRLPRLTLAPGDAALLAPAAPAQLVAVGADVLLLAGAEPCACFGGDDALGEVFVNAAAAALGAVRTVADHEAHMARQLALTRAAKTLNESLDLPTLLGRICEEAIGLLDADNAAVYRGTRAGGFVVGGVAGLPPEFVGVPLEPGSGLAGQVVERERPMLTNDYQQTTTVPPGSPFSRVRASSASPSAGTTSCAAC